MIEINNRVILILIGFFLGVILTIIIIIYLQMTNPLRIEKKGHYLVKSKKIRREIIKIPIKTPFKEIYGDNYRDMIKAKGLSKNFKENDEYLYGEIYTSINTPKEKSPLLIFCHGLGGYHNDLNFEQLCTSLALGGYTILAYDHRGHGKSTAYAFSKNEGLLIFKYIYHDIEDVINYAMKLPNIDKERIGLIGFSLGAGVVMTKPLNDPRIKLIIAGCGMNSLKDVYQHLKNSRIFSMGWLFYKFMNMKIKIKTEDLEKYKDIFEVDANIREDIDYNNRVFLAHCKDDEIVPFWSFKKNIRSLRLNESNYIIFEHGGHEFNYKTLPLLSQILIWLKNL